MSVDESVERVPSRPISHKLSALQAWSKGYSAIYDHLRIIVTEACHDDMWWFHVSVSRMDKTMPTYNDLKTIKEIVLGDERTAIQVFPPASEHIDIAGKYGIEVLHLWSPEVNILPDFTEGGKTI